MTVLLFVTLGVALWLLVPLPLAVAVGRAFRAGDAAEGRDADAPSLGIVRDYDAVGM
jgi:hypothetical protein